MKNEIEQVLSEAKAMAFVQVVRRHKDATLGDVMALAAEMGMSHMNINQVLFEDLPKSGKRWAKKNKALAAGGGHETRTGDGRRKYDAAVLKFIIKNKKLKSAIEIRSAVGGSPNQARRALNRLIERGLVEFTGQARATRYKARAS